MLAARTGAGLVALVVTVTLVTTFTASTNVPASTVGTSTNARSIPQLSPAGCNSLTLTGLAQGSGTFSNSQSHTLVLASAGSDTITDSGTGNCIVGGGGTDSVTGTSADICISGPTLGVANPCPTAPTFGPATQIVLSVSTANLASGSTRAATATIEDAAGNTVTSGADATDSIVFSQASGTGTVTGLGSATATAGVATQTVTGALAGTVTLKAVGTLNGTARTSNTISFTVTFGPTSHIVLTGGTTLASASSQTLTATVEDAAGNTVTTGTDSSSTMTFAQPTGSGSVTGLGTATSSGGVATKAVTGVLAGPANLTAAATLTRGSTTSNALAVTVTFGPATQLVLSGSSAVLVGGATRTFTATIEDAAGNTVTSGTDATDSIAFSQASGTGTVTGLGSATATAGVAAQTVTGALAGTVVLKAAATLNGTARTSNTISFTVSAPAITSPTVANPENPGKGGTATFTMTGTGFVSGLTVTGNGSATVNSFTWISSTSITVNVTGNGATAANGSFTVTNPDGGTVTSPNGSFRNGP